MCRKTRPPKTSLGRAKRQPQDSNTPHIKSIKNIKYKVHQFHNISILFCSLAFRYASCIVRPTISYSGYWPFQSLSVGTVVTMRRFVDVLFCIHFSRHQLVIPFARWRTTYGVALTSVLELSTESYNCTFTHWNRWETEEITYALVISWTYFVCLLNFVWIIYSGTQKVFFGSISSN